MTGSDYGNLAYLVLLGLAVGGWLIASNRESTGKMLKQAATWALIFVGVALAVGLWTDIRSQMPQQSVLSERAISVPRGYDGHYRLTLEINGAPVDFVVDTGASEMVLSRADAKAVGIDLADLAYTGTAATANGTVRTAPVRLETVSLGPIEDRNVRALVNEGELYGSLLGMGYLQRFERIEIADDELILTR
ncbi:retropepsin-like aspartic protease family protein [Histidinibacterium aquaticum]|uniref:TIGR02281 family clan AA aspartic protease n=1 Tax=Histidinibacterium aquaticum TaxID=2613962 RepID=A0A5J5GBX9_9RHOB|nr:TIGR02281 family clan AA aspartic protease [Histidinibacterium aquaticum]KAA9005655.1 TIGR02281 family clan AA aspartic protease [Histidinibacterium aquaticum]